MPQNNVLEIYDQRPGFWQWDTGQKLLVLDRTIDQVHFSNKDLSTALVEEVSNENGIRTCDVPDVLLKMPKPLIAYAYAMDDDNNRTICAVKFSVSPRPIPEDYTYEENNRFKDLVDKIESVQDALENGAGVNKFNNIEYAKAWAEDYQAAGSIVSVWNGFKWALYMVDRDYSLYPIGDTDQLIINVDKLQNLVGDDSVSEQIRVAILSLNLPNTYEPIGEANKVRNELIDETNRAKNEEAAITRELHKINNNISQLQNDLKTNKDDADASIKKITDDYLKNADKVALERKIQTNSDAIELLTNGVNADEVDGVNDLIQYVKEHGTEVTGIKTNIKTNEDAIKSIKDDYLKSIDKIELERNIQYNSDEIKSVKNDYLKSSDKIEISNLITTLDNRIGDVQTEVEDQINSINDKIDNSDERIDALEKRLNEGVVPDGGFVTDGNFISFNEQNLTEGQQAQARKNIGIEIGEYDAIELVVEIGLVSPVAAEDGSVYTDENGAMYSL